MSTPIGTMWIHFRSSSTGMEKESRELPGDESRGGVDGRAALPSDSIDQSSFGIGYHQRLTWIAQHTAGRTPHMYDEIIPSVTVNP